MKWCSERLVKLKWSNVTAAAQLLCSISEQNIPRLSQRDETVTGFCRFVSFGTISVRNSVKGYRADGHS